MAPVWPRKLEVIHVRDEEQLQVLVPVATLPPVNGLEARRGQVSIATLPPVAPRAQVAVKRESKRGNWVNHARVDPRLRPL
eukprot:14359197-Alexandrium_andersonii.AAC.1